MTTYSRKNSCGVYTDRELIELPLDRKGWRGCPLAEIRLAFTEAGWRSQVAYSFTTGNMSGASSPITDHDPAFGARDDAVRHASQLLRRSMETGRFEEVMQPQRRKILEWLDSLQPAQLTLF